MGVDLYCVAVASDRPFLHVWMLVRTGGEGTVRPMEQGLAFDFENKQLRLSTISMFQLIGKAGYTMRP